MWEPTCNHIHHTKCIIPSSAADKHGIQGDLDVENQQLKSTFHRERDTGMLFVPGIEGCLLPGDVPARAKAKWTMALDAHGLWTSLRLEI